MIIGSHVSLKGKEMLVGSVKEALSYGSNALMIYTGAPQNTRRKAMDRFRLNEAKKLLKEQGIPMTNIVVHAPYIMNLANGDPEKREFAVDFFTKEIKRTEAIGAGQIVLHPGAHVRQGVEQGTKHIIEGLNKVIENTMGSNVLIALETMAGKGTEIGRSFEELAAIFAGVTHDERLSVCFDTCHTHDAGYDTRDDFDSVLEEFDRIIGIKRISVVHVNDSKNIKGAQKDRHENIGFGKIGFEALHYIVHHPKLKAVPKILETPYVTPVNEPKNKKFPPYKYEIEMLKDGIFKTDLLDIIRKKDATL